MSRRRYGVALLLVAGAMAWWLWPCDVELRASPVGDPRGAEGEASLRVSASAAKHVHAEDRSEVVTTAAPRSRQVRIVDANGDAVAGAAVRFATDATSLEVGDPAPTGNLTLAQNDLELGLAVMAPAMSGGDGIAGLPTETTCAFVIARLGALYGQGTLRFDDPLVDCPELVLMPDRSLRVRVVGANGAPCAGVVVSAGLRVPRTGRRFGALLPTEANGTTVLWHAGALAMHDDVVRFEVGAGSRHRFVDVDQSMAAAGVTELRVDDADMLDVEATPSAESPDPHPSRGELFASGRTVDAETGLPVASRAGFLDSWLTADGDLRSGRFDLFGDRRDTASIEFRARGFLSERVRLTRGATDIRVPLKAATRLRATVRVDDAIDVERLGIEVAVGERRIGAEIWHPGLGAPSPDYTHVRRRGVLQRFFDGVEGTDGVLEVAARAGGPPVHRIPQEQWRPVRGGFAVDLDLRSVFANARVQIRRGDEATRAACYVRSRGSGTPWSRVDVSDGESVPIARGDVLECVAVNTTCVATELRQGDNRIGLPAPARLHVRTATAGRFEPSVKMSVYLLERHEPSLDLVAPMRSAFPRPSNVSELMESENIGGWESGDLLSEMAIGARGRYLVVPVVLDADGDFRSVLAAAVPFEVVQVGESIEVTVDVDVTRLRALLPTK